MATSVVLPGANFVRLASVRITGPGTNNKENNTIVTYIILPSINRNDGPTKLEKCPSLELEKY